MSRTRQKRPLAAGYISGGQAYVSNTWLETMVESRVPGPCEVTHTSHKGVVNFVGISTSDWKTCGWINQPTPSFVWDRIPPPKVDWNKLPTSSQFSLIQFFAELDDTLGLFSKRLFTELSYGSVTWGILPFVNDVKALLQTISNLSKSIKNIPYEDVIEGKVTVNELVNDYVLGTVTYKQRLSGVLDLSFASESDLWLDRLGFHPDIGTLYDLIPMSFVIDWMLPVGDYLTSLSGRGWVDSSSFSGWYTVKANFQGSRKPSVSHWPQQYYPGYDCDYFARRRWNHPIPVAFPEPKFAFELPSIRELFNMFYLGASRRRAGLPF